MYLPYCICACVERQQMCRTAPQGNTQLPIRGALERYGSSKAAYATGVAFHTRGGKGGQSHNRSECLHARLVLYM